MGSKSGIITNIFSKLKQEKLQHFEVINKNLRISTVDINICNHL